MIEYTHRAFGLSSFTCDGYMFNSLSNKLTEVLGKLRGRGTLSEADIDSAMREVRIALLEADVALPIVKSLYPDRLKLKKRWALRW